MDVPSYRQNYDFTCGPASLMMAMKYLDRRIELAKELEVDIWREANMIEIYGASRYGLALSAAMRGFKVKIYSNTKGAGFVDKLEPVIENMNKGMFRLQFNERRERCKRLGVEEEKVARVTGDHLRSVLLSGAIPIVLSNTSFFSAEDVPHWVVVSGIDESNLLVNNPLRRGGAQKVPLSSMKRVIGYKGDQCMLAISSKKQRDGR